MAEVTVPAPTPRVLSIQSHTVHGFVGNKCATFPLQLHGFDVDSINSVQFSNHTGYPHVKGQVLNGTQLDELMEGLSSNKLVQYTHVLTGYIGSLSFLESVVRAVQLAKDNNPNVVYVCDPVMGDRGVGLYVPESLVAAYREKILPLASVLMPNQFEAEHLTGTRITSQADAIQACKSLHKAGPHTVIITSVDYESEPESIYVFASHRTSEGEYEQCQVCVPRQGGYYTGTGDLMAALVLVWLTKLKSLASALVHTVSTMQAVIARTRVVALTDTQPRPIKGGVPVPPELCVVQSRADLERPNLTVVARPVASRIRGVIFDLDGTLTMPHQIDFAAMRLELGVVGDMDILDHLDGLPAAQATTAENIIEQIELRQYTKGVLLQQSVSECVGGLVCAGVRVGLVTLAGKASVDAFMMAAHIPQGTFDPIITRADTSISRKPSADPARHICDAWNIPPSHVLFVGDSWKDQNCGSSAGCSTCHIASRLVSPLPSPMPVDYVGWDHSIELLDQLLPLIQAVNAEPAELSRP
eukprot:c11884_g1_i1.p1 GENE.c11884_g1_i1~~c11884_g1_i1.p1  ORF type:complete len:542 (-),score=112.48 c11884_g1_i1:117-1700(-)